MPLGCTANYVVQPVGDAITLGNHVHVRADIVHEKHTAGFDSRVLLRLTLADWYLVRHGSLPWKIFQAKSCSNPEEGQVILDCTGPDAVIISQIPISSHEHLTVAEMFAGGYQGWSQAAWILRQKSVPLSMKWGIEKAADCIPMQRFVNPNQVEAASTSELLQYQGSSNFIMAIGDAWDNWWLRTYNIHPINTLAVSAPCQPWSYAGRETGLQSEVGRLMLRVIDIAAALGVEYVILEQVTGFKSHPHYQHVMTAWDDAGFCICWRASLDLAEVLPCQRARHLIVLKNRAFGQPSLPPAFVWKCPSPGTLHSTQALLDLPPCLAAQCTPSPETLSLYLNPALIPCLRSAACTMKPREFRVRQGHQVSSCFLVSSRLIYSRAKACLGH